MGDLTGRIISLDERAHSIVISAENSAAEITEKANVEYNQIISSYIEKVEKEREMLFEQAKKEIEEYRKKRKAELQKILSEFEKLSKENREKFIEKVFNNLRGRICG
ncbi:hypothetical protein [Desulfurobacterium atlanticum]|uniref:Uncharacterized protein n=1 Tax=Desulfurobacterium atlanticum TaxID=240169 RepID=A0A238XSK8_9BACT|nr:hypothetical protein [Desulfurobacterium atlanticum]SNR61558.1 hypothetical protein SAMN06265340_101207 [Desulfurobacterium atlanticum]